MFRPFVGATSTKDQQIGTREQKRGLSVQEAHRKLIISYRNELEEDCTFRWEKNEEVAVLEL